MRLLIPIFGLVIAGTVGHTTSATTQWSPLASAFASAASSEPNAAASRTDGVGDNEVWPQKLAENERTIDRLETHQAPKEGTDRPPKARDTDDSETARSVPMPEAAEKIELPKKDEGDDRGKK